MVLRISGQRQALLEILRSGHQIVYDLSDFQVINWRSFSGMVAGV